MKADTMISITAPYQALTWEISTGNSLFFWGGELKFLFFFSIKNWCKAYEWIKKEEWLH